MTTSLLIAALAMGFFGSPHCLGMCGGIIAAFGISMKSLTPTKRKTLIATYHIGRLFSYMILGVIATIVGSTVIAPFFTDNNLPRILLGGALIFSALLMLGTPFLSRLEKLGLGLWNKLTPMRQKVLPIDSIPKALAAGLLWGLLPCGLVYGALVMAVSISATQISLLSGSLFMLFFGLGTLPMLIATDTMIAWLQKTVARFSLRKFSGALMLISGLAVALSPTVMHMMHGHGSHGHHHAHGHMHDTSHEHSKIQHDHDHHNTHEHQHH